MEHLNYCRQIARHLEAAMAIPNIARQEAHNMLQVSTLITASRKFLLPPGGRLLDDFEMRALVDLELRLPFPFVAIEFASLDRLHDESRNVVFAWDYEDSQIAVRRVVFCASRGAWGIGEPCLISRTDYMREIVGGVREMVIRPIFEEGRRKDAGADTIAPSILLSFLNALACSNVHTQLSEPKKAGKKIKAALPFDAYHVLTIDVPGKAGEGAATGGHRSPREHLRRGHIRRLADGRRIWVNATVVAAGRGAGVVTKDYAVRCAA